MTIYVLTLEPYHDNGKVIGAYSTLGKAQAKIPGEWGIFNDKPYIRIPEEIQGHSTIDYQITTLILDE